MSENKRKLALITAATGGIGTATAKALALKGYDLALHYFSRGEHAGALAAELRQHAIRVEVFQADLTNYEGAKSLHKEVVASMGDPDVLFNLAGLSGKAIGPQGNLQELGTDDFEFVWRVNCGVPFELTRLCLPAMEAAQFGRVIFCSSVAAFTGGVIGPHYASSKSALHGYVHWLASRYAKVGITANAVAPALIDTPTLPGSRDKYKAMIPVGRMGLGEEVANVVEMMVTTAYMTNKIIMIDGGMVPR